MSQDTMALEAMIEREDTETVDASPSRRGWLSRGTYTEKKHRIHDYVSRLKRELMHSQELNETMSRNLSAQILETKAANETIDELRTQVEELKSQLKTAEDANVANSRNVDFNFHQRDISGHEDRSTMPVPQLQLLKDELNVKTEPSSAAAMLLERVIPRVSRVKTSDETESRFLAMVASVTQSSHVGRDHVSEELRTLDRVASTPIWNARPSHVVTPVTWGNERRVTGVNESNTGTLRVTTLHQRGAGPTAVPGFNG